MVCIFPYSTSFHSLLTCADNLQSKKVTRDKINITAKKCRIILGLEPQRCSLDTCPASTLYPTEPRVCYCHNNDVGNRSLSSRYITLPGGVFQSATTNKKQDWKKHYIYFSKLGAIYTTVIIVVSATVFRVVDWNSSRTINN